MNTSRTLRALAVVPVLGALALGPAAAFADQGAHYRENTAGARHERSADVRQLLDTSLADDEGMLDAHRGAKGTLAHSSSTLAHGKLMRGMFADHGKHRGWFARNDATSTWGSQIFTSIKDDSFKNFMTAASNTPLGSSTTQAIFEKLALASDKIDAGKSDEAKTIMKELRDGGYRFKKLFHDSLRQLFPNTH